MLNRAKETFDRFDNARFHVRLNLALIVVWLFLFIPSLLYWKESIVWLVFMSCYANLAGHISAYMGSKAELQAEENGS